MWQTTKRGLPKPLPSPFRRGVWRSQPPSAASHFMPTINLYVGTSYTERECRQFISVPYRYCCAIDSFCRWGDTSAELRHTAQETCLNVVSDFPCDRFALMVSTCLGTTPWIFDSPTLPRWSTAAIKLKPRLLAWQAQRIDSRLRSIYLLFRGWIAKLVGLGIRGYWRNKNEWKGQKLYNPWLSLFLSFWSK